MADSTVVTSAAFTTEAASYDSLVASSAGLTTTATVVTYTSTVASSGAFTTTATGVAILTVAGYPPPEGQFSVLDDTDPVVQDGDRFEYEVMTNLGANVSMNADGTFTIDAEGVHTFGVRIWDSSDSTWGDWGTITVDGESDTLFAQGISTGAPVIASPEIVVYGVNTLMAQDIATGVPTVQSPLFTLTTRIPTSGLGSVSRSVRNSEIAYVDRDNSIVRGLTVYGETLSTEQLKAIVQISVTVGNTTFNTVANPDLVLLKNGDVVFYPGRMSLPAGHYPVYITVFDAAGGSGIGWDTFNLHVQVWPTIH